MMAAPDLISTVIAELEAASAVLTPYSAEATDHAAVQPVTNALHQSGSFLGLHQELEAALTVLDPQIIGVTDLVLHPITNALQRELNAAGATMTHRRELIQQALTDIDKLLGDLQHGSIKQILDDINKLLEDLTTLQNDGYPTPQTFELSDVLLGELNTEVAEAQAGAGVFHGSRMATTLEVTLGEPVPKPPPLSPRSETKE